LQQNYNDIFEKYAIAQDQLEAITSGMTGEELVKAINNALHQGPLQILTTEYYRDQAYLKLRTQCVQAMQDLEETKKREQELGTQLADKDRELLDARAHLSAVDKDRLEAIEELRTTDKLISESLRAELDRLRDEHNFLLNERDAQKTQLIEVLLAKEQLRKEAEGRDPQDPTLGTGDSDVAAAYKKSQEKIEKLRERLKERQQVSGKFHFLTNDLEYCIVAERDENDEEPELWPAFPLFWRPDPIACTTAHIEVPIMPIKARLRHPRPEKGVVSGLPGLEICALVGSSHTFRTRAHAFIFI
jgi:transcriptional regulator